VAVAPSGLGRWGGGTRGRGAHRLGGQTQVIEDVAHDGEIGDARQNADTPAAELAAQDVDAKTPA